MSRRWRPSEKRLGRNVLDLCRHLLQISLVGPTCRCKIGALCTTNKCGAAEEPSWRHQSGEGARWPRSRTDSVGWHDYRCIVECHTFKTCRRRRLQSHVAGRKKNASWPSEKPRPRRNLGGQHQPGTVGHRSTVLNAGSLLTGSASESSLLDAMEFDLTTADSDHDEDAITGAAVGEMSQRLVPQRAFRRRLHLT